MNKFEEFWKPWVLCKRNVAKPMCKVDGTNIKGV